MPQHGGRFRSDQLVVLMVVRLPLGMLPTTTYVQPILFTKAPLMSPV